MSSCLEMLPKGHEFPPVAFELSPRWVQEYVAAVEDWAVGGLGQDLVPPMALAALSIRALLDSAKLPSGAIHLGQELAFLRPVSVGERLSTQALIASRGERQGWVVMGIDLRVEDGARVTVMTGRATVTMPANAEPESKA